MSKTNKPPKHSTKLNYVWLDGYEQQNLRSKIKVIKSKDLLWFETKNNGWVPNIGSLPQWNFDGSSTRQAPGSSSECLLQPVRIYRTHRNHDWLVLCEVLNADGTPHASNKRAELREQLNNTEDKKFWWGFEQEYFITKDFKPLGFPEGGYPKPQGLYYCGVGSNQVVGRNFVMEHLNRCLSMGITLTGVNAEVAVGQWEFQCFAKDTLKAADDLWVSRYMMYEIAERYGYDIDISPKPVLGDWNGSGCHTNFSFKEMRKNWSEKKMKTLMSKFSKRHEEHIAGYGVDNDKRLTGNHETQHIGTFSVGVGDRGASIRIPTAMKQNNWNGYIEDRRPASNCDPYVVCKLIVETTVNEGLEKTAKNKKPKADYEAATGSF